MKKIRILGIVCLVIILFIGCYPSKAAEVIVKDGQYYLRVNNGRRLGYPDVKQSTKFDSVQDIKDRIKYSDFDSSKVNSLYNCFYNVKGDDKLLPILDPDKIVIPTFNGEVNYKRVGFVNLCLWCEQYVTVGGSEYELSVDAVYYPEIIDKLESLVIERKETLNSYRSVEGSEYEQFTQDGIQKERVNGQSNYKYVSYEMTQGELDYFVVEEHRKGQLIKLNIYGKNDVGGLLIRMYMDESSQIEINDIYQMLACMNLKKA